MCEKCQNMGYLDYEGFRMDPCGCNIPPKVSREPTGAFCPGGLHEGSCFCDTDLHGPKECKYHDRR